MARPILRRSFIFPGLIALALVASTPLGRVATSQQRPTPTFTKDVARIFQENCQACHRPDSIAPMSLLTYEQSRPLARAIRQQVISRNMPPWHLDKTVGVQHFANDRSLSDQDIDTIVRWVDGGAPQGDPKDMPPAKVWPEDSVWNFAKLFGGPPDLIVKSPLYTVPAVAVDAWFKPTVETGLTEQRWVRAIEIRPATVKGRKVTHHALARLSQQEPGAAPNPLDDGGAAAAVATADGLFMEWAIGKQGEIMRANSGKLMRPGSKIVFEVHYHAVGEEITDQVELGIYFYPKGQEPKYRQTLGLFNAVAGGSRNIDIPPNATFVTQAETTLRGPGRVENFQPHMHLRGKAMQVEAILPDGTTTLLSKVDKFDFRWMNNYVYADDTAPLLPRGTKLRVTAWYDNTKNNVNNPDADQWVGFGDRTVDEMGHAWINLTYMSDEDFAQEVAKRKQTVASLGK
jgi:mono/diheme cytochrome c family protein